MVYEKVEIKVMQLIVWEKKLLKMGGGERVK